MANTLDLLKMLSIQNLNQMMNSSSTDGITNMPLNPIQTMNLNWFQIFNQMGLFNSFNSPVSELQQINNIASFVTSDQSLRNLTLLNSLSKLIPNSLSNDNLVESPLTPSSLGARATPSPQAQLSSSSSSSLKTSHASNSTDHPLDLSLSIRTNQKPPFANKDNASKITKQATQRKPTYNLSKHAFSNKNQKMRYLFQHLLDSPPNSDTHSENENDLLSNSSGSCSSFISSLPSSECLSENVTDLFASTAPTDDSSSTIKLDENKQVNTSLLEPEVILLASTDAYNPNLSGKTKMKRKLAVMMDDKCSENISSSGSSSPNELINESNDNQSCAEDCNDLVAKKSAKKMTTSNKKRLSNNHVYNIFNSTSHGTSLLVKSEMNINSVVNNTINTTATIKSTNESKSMPLVNNTVDLNSKSMGCSSSPSSSPRLPSSSTSASSSTTTLPSSSSPSSASASSSSSSPASPSLSSDIGTCSGATTVTIGKSQLHLRVQPLPRVSDANASSTPENSSDNLQPEVVGECKSAEDASDDGRSADAPKTACVTTECAFTCELCDQTFVAMDRLNKHKASRHKIRKTSTSGQVQGQHLNDADESGENSGMVKNKGFACSQCDRSFSRSDMLTRHNRLHSGIKPYMCDVCDQVFSRSDHLATHKRTHSGEKPYKCSVCNYSACRRDMITRHMKTHNK